MFLDGLTARFRSAVSGLAGVVRPVESAGTEIATVTGLPLGTISIAAELLRGGVTVTSEQPRPEGGRPLLATSLVQIDGDLVVKIDRDTLTVGPDRLRAFLTSHLDQLDAVLRPLRQLKTVVLTLRSGFVVLGLGLEVQPAQQILPALFAGQADRILELAMSFALEIGLGVLSLIVSYVLPWVLNLWIRLKARQIGL